MVDQTHSEATQKVARWVLVFAVLVVALTICFIAYQQLNLTNILSTSDWCARAIKAEALTGQRAETSCATLLVKQIGALAINSHIYAGTMALCLLVLIVIVVAQGQLSFSVSKAGASAGIGRQAPAVEAARETAAAAVDKSKEIEANASAPPPEPE